MLSARGGTDLWGGVSPGRSVDVLEWHDLKGEISRKCLSGKEVAPGARGPRGNSSLGRRGLWRFVNLLRNYQMEGQDLKDVISREWISGERGAPGALGPRRNSSLGR